MLFFPPIALFFLFRYPRECLGAFLVCVAGIVLICAGIAFATVNTLHTPDTTVPNLNSN